MGLWHGLEEERTEACACASVWGFAGGGGILQLLLALGFLCHSQLLLAISMEKSAEGLLRLEIGCFSVVYGQAK